MTRHAVHRLLPPQRLLTPRPAWRGLPDGRGLLPGAPVPAGRDFHPLAWSGFQDAICHQCNRKTAPPRGHWSHLHLHCDTNEHFYEIFRHRLVISCSIRLLRPLAVRRPAVDMDVGSDSDPKYPHHAWSRQDQERAQTSRRRCGSQPLGGPRRTQSGAADDQP
jgi:hypothetical protein